MRSMETECYNSQSNNMRSPMKKQGIDRWCSQKLADGTVLDKIAKPKRSIPSDHCKADLGSDSDGEESTRSAVEFESSVTSFGNENRGDEMSCDDNGDEGTSELAFDRMANSSCSSIDVPLRLPRRSTRPSTSTSETRRGVRFAPTARVRDYALTVGDNPSTGPCAMSLDWNRTDEYHVHIDAIDRPSKARVRALATKERRQRIMVAMGISKQELRKMERDIVTSKSWVDEGGNHEDSSDEISTASQNTVAPIPRNEKGKKRSA